LLPLWEVGRVSPGQISLFATEEDQTANLRSEGRKAAAAATGNAPVLVTPPPARRHSGRVSATTDPAVDLVRRSLPLTIPAPNGEAWVGRPLRLEVESPRARASLPMAMAMGEASFPRLPHGRFAGCELTTELYWLAEPDGTHGTVLVPRGHFWVRDGNNGHSDDRGLPGVRLRVADEDGFCRLGPCPPEAAAVARRLHREPVPGRWFPDEIEDVPEREVDALLRAVAGSRLVTSARLGTMFPDAVGPHHVTSRPFPVTGGGCENGHIRIEDPRGIHCGTEFDRLCGVRVSESALGAEILLDLWRADDGFHATWHLRFSSIPGGTDSDVA
jgi:hypothetical protein